MGVKSTSGRWGEMSAIDTREQTAFDHELEIALVAVLCHSYLKRKCEIYKLSQVHYSSIAYVVEW